MMHVTHCQYHCVLLCRKGKSAKERCHKRISDLKQQFDSDVQVALQKNTFLQNMSRALDMEEEEEDLSKDMFDVPVSEWPALMKQYCAV